MAITIHIPTPLRPFLDGQDTVAVETEGAVGELLRQLAAANGELGKHLFGADGSLRNFVNVYVNEEDIRYQDGEDTAVKNGDTISIVPSIAGGSGASLSAAELARYSRHILIPDVGRAGQERLKAGSALLIGAGGLGSPLALYLAAAGVGAHRHRGVRQDRRDQPAAPDSVRHLAGGTIQAAARAGTVGRSQPGHHHRAARGAAHLGQRAGAVRALRRGGRRHRQLPHPATW